MKEKREKDVRGKEKFDFGIGLGGILGGFTDLVQKLSDLSEKAGEFSKTGEIGGERIKGVYGFTVRTGLGGKEVKIEPFGNIHKDRTTGQSVVQEIREPMVDIFEEQDHVLVVAEMPGVGVEDIKIDLAEDILTLHAEKGDKKYRKEVLLSRSFEGSKMTVTCNNGIVQVKLLK